MISIDSIWLATEPMDVRASTETALIRVIAVFGAAKPHCAYLFANRRATRMKVLAANLRCLFAEGVEAPSFDPSAQVVTLDKAAVVENSVR
ncbi:IS66 family insertion sequence element accessory protein TnpB [Pseudomonas sp. PCH199]|uniref:IS66 family insertion sequence element accessory protein TnpB n=1 Tax=unclassified Pseudomonas TaxID=196821 RepID=UPI001140A7A6|nr:MULTISPECIES: IS66 family insertion sequence element accessory protein TnpB [unclassified Pseudomonas]MCW8279195.1 IS66 family insertion sequence element accessory protein TnpB [Pseudomonas sp. PCH199]